MQFALSAINLTVVDGAQKSSISTKVYLKAGEYGETEIDNDWSVFREPLNAWSSLFFSFFGKCTFIMVRNSA